MHLLVQPLLSPKPLQDVVATDHSVPFFLGKNVVKNLEQLHVLQSLMEDAILSRDEFTEQKHNVLQFLNNPV